MKAIHTVERWAADNDMKINKKKSAIMRINVDDRQLRVKKSQVEKIRGYEQVHVYKYLGVQIDSSFNLREDLNSRNEKKRKVLRQIANVTK